MPNCAASFSALARVRLKMATHSTPASSRQAASWKGAQSRRRKSKSEGLHGDVRPATRRGAGCFLREEIFAIAVGMLCMPARMSR